MSDLIYLDHAATTAVHPDVLKEMLPYFTDKFGNPSSVYGFAANNKNKLTEARRDDSRSSWCKTGRNLFYGRWV